MEKIFKEGIKLCRNQRAVRNMKYSAATDNRFTTINYIDQEYASRILNSDEYFIWAKMMSFLPYKQIGLKKYTDVILYKNLFMGDEELGLDGGLTEWQYRKGMNGLIEKGYMVEVDKNFFEVYPTPYDQPLPDEFIEKYKKDRKYE